jgi:hypothetical protein
VGRLIEINGEKFLDAYFKNGYPLGLLRIINDDGTSEEMECKDWGKKI